MLKAIVFDFDGTILDTETPWYYALREAYQEYGEELPLELYSQCVGTNNHTFNPYEYLMTEKGLPIDKDEFRGKVQAYYAGLMSKQTVREGVLELLSQAREAGLRIGLASSSSRIWIDKHLDELGLKEHFEAIKTSDDVTNVKPDPELYRKALEELGVAPEEAVAVEDSPNGARAAAAAGMTCIVVPNELTGLLSFDPGDAYIRAASLTHIDFDALVKGKR
ncbi:HAD family hydrolase [Paenibacillus nanensis]|uniref:HAD family hydrolase n=1 Tax=Paenibacillus nanensis TaxID=393251 RepID=A0A3A1VH25_9BACL|nr:HAD-IA family hydrolase [Paenibacillus nanensis]RIX60219.1 HAD family hydrolase [Paenibacillus nanensis]